MKALLLFGVESVLDVLVVFGRLDAAAGAKVAELAEALHHGRTRPAHVHTAPVAPAVLVLNTMRTSVKGTGNPDCGLNV